MAHFDSDTGSDKHKNHRDSRSGHVVVLDQALWERIAEGDSLQSTLQAWLTVISGMLQGVQQAVVVTSRALNSAEDSEQPAAGFDPVAVWPESGQVNRNLAKAIELSLGKQIGIVKRPEAKGESLTHIGFPLRLGSKVMGAVGIALRQQSSAAIRNSMRQLELGAGWFEALVRRHQAQNSGTREQSERLSLDLIQNILDEKHFKSACIEVVNELATHLRCERVSCGFLIGNNAKVFSLSHSVQVDSKLNLLNAIAAAMDEAIDQHAVVMEPASHDQDGSPISKAARTLMRETYGGQVVSCPFEWRGHTRGALVFEKAEDQAFSDAELLTCQLITRYVGPLLEEKRLEQRWFGARFLDQAGQYLQLLFGPGALVLKTVTALLLVTTLGLAFWQTDYRVSSPASLRGEQQRILAAPFDGYIASADYHSGDRVNEGDVIASMDDRELLLERLNWLTQQRQYELEFDRALGTQDRAEIGVIRARIDQAEAQVALLDAQLERSSMMAPFDGIIVSGDLRDSIGGAIRKGDVLFEIVPTSDYRVIIEVDETDVQYVEPGQTGQLALTSLPDANLPLRVNQVGSVSTSQEGGNFFEVEARLDVSALNDDSAALVADELRPGMEGIAKVTTLERSLLWIWTHRFTDWLKLKLWSIWP